MSRLEIVSYMLLCTAVLALSARRRETRVAFIVAILALALFMVATWR
jgi:hypothetical protein